MGSESEILRARVNLPAQIPADWEWAKLTECCRPRQWRTIAKEDLTSTGYPVFGANGQIGYYSEANHAKDTIAITCRGATCGTVNWIPGPSYITGNSMALDEVNTDRVLQDFLYFALKYRNVSDVVSGSAQPQITRQNLAVVSFPAPPIGEQRKIAAILSSVDEAIEKTQAVIDQVQVVKKGLMQELLTRGLPGHHKKFKQTEIGEIPASWELRPLGELGNVSSGGTPSRTEPSFWNGDIPWVKTNQVKYEGIYDTDEKITQAGLEHSAARLLPPGTILMAMYGQGLTRGRVGWLGVAAATNQACAAIEPTSAAIGSYLYQILAAKYDEIRSIGNEGSQKNLNLSLVKGILLPVPTPAEQQAIAAILNECDGRTRCEQSALAGLQQLKQALMAVLLTGELRVTP